MILGHEVSSVKALQFSSPERCQVTDVSSGGVGKSYPLLTKKFALWWNLAYYVQYRGSNGLNPGMAPEVGQELLELGSRGRAT